MTSIKKFFIHSILFITIKCSFFSTIASIQQINRPIKLNLCNNDYTFHLTESNNPKINNPITNGLDSFNTKKIGVINFDHCTIVVKNKKNKIIAGAKGDICRSHAIGEVCEFNGIWVDEQYKNQNIDTYIMNTFLDYITHKNCSIIQIEVHGIRNKSKEKKFYEKFGFVTDATVPELGNIDTYIMRLPLHNRIVLPSPPIPYKLRLKISRSKHDDEIDKRLHSSSNTACSVVSEQPYTIFVTSTKNKIIAGTIGQIIEYKNMGKSCKISTVWVDEKHRQCGLGKEIMNATINYAKNKKCQNIHVETYEWQAKPFYEKCGFTTVAVAPNVQKMRGLEQYYMKKILPK